MEDRLGPMPIDPQRKTGIDRIRRDFAMKS